MPEMEARKKVQQIKVARGISFLGARKAALSEQPTSTSSKRTAAFVVSGSTTVSSQRSRKQTVSIGVCPKWIDLEPMPFCQSKPIVRLLKLTTNRKKTTSSSPPPRSNKARNPPVALLVKAVRRTLTPAVFFIFKKERQAKNKPSPSTHR